MCIKINHYKLVDGYHSLGFFSESFPEIKWINCFISPGYRLDVENLKKDIEGGLAQKKSIAIVIWDERIIFPVQQEFVDLLNSYQHDPLWLVTQLHADDQLIYTFQHKINCKLIELPWWWLNDVLCYYNMDRLINSTHTVNSNYLCMVGRIDPHKLNLIRELEKYQVDQYGLITLSRPVEEFKNNKFVTINPHPPYRDLQTSNDKMAAQKKYNDTWVSANVQNFLHIEEQYSNIPLVIHSETTNGIFFSTEKSLWPMLLGKMVLVHGRPGVMKYIQRFYDFDISRYANLNFDQITEYSDQSHHLRLSRLVEDNVDLLKNSHEVYKDCKLELEESRWTVGKNLFDFSIKQINQILEGN